MSWEQERGPGSFRGLVFEAVAFEKVGGRVLHVDKIPESDDHAVAELGAKPLRFRVQGYVHGDDYLDQVGNLEAAFLKPGAAELVLPWRGRFMVFVEDYRFTHDVSGGVGEFEAEFLPAGIETRPSVTVITETDVIEKGETAGSAAESDFARVAAIIHALPGYLREVSNAAMVAEAADITEILGLAGDEEATLVARASIETVDTLSGLVRYLQRDATHVPAGGATEAGQVAAEGVQAYVTMMRAFVLSRAAELALEQGYSSAGAATEMQTILVRAIDEDLALEPADDVFTALTDLRAAIIAAMSEIAARLPRLKTLHVAAPTPALVLAFDLYADVTREDELLSLNGGGHPGFMVGDLQVLTR